MKYISSKKIIISSIMLFSALFAASARKPSKKSSVNFTDDLGRKVSVQKTENAAVLQGSLASLWILAGGKMVAATTDCFVEPPEMTKDQAESFNSKWATSGFSAHKKGIFEYLGCDSKNIEDIGPMMSPSAEKIIASGADFAIMSANITGHKKIMSLLENAGIKCAFFNYDDFNSYLRIMQILTDITGKSDLYKKNALSQKSKIEKIISLSKSKTPPTILALRSSSGKVEAKSSDNLSLAAMLRDIGCKNIADTDSYYKENLSMEKIISDDPDFIFVATMGTNEEKALKYIEENLNSHPAWKDLKAVRNGNYYILPRELFHFKPGTRWGESYEVLFRIVYGTSE